jgi:ABC-type branched-subunit amino acid transport system substrate-binding protein
METWQRAIAAAPAGRAPIRLGLARCLRRSDPATARREAEAAVTELEGAARAEAYEILADLSLGAGEVLRAAHALARAWRYAPPALRTVLFAHARRLPSANPAQVRLAYDLLEPDRFPGGHLAIALARAALASGRADEARTLLDRSRAAIEEDPAIAAAAREVRQRLASPSIAGGRPRVAVLAPLSGPAQEIGERITRGAALAAGDAIEVVVRDTRGDPEEAARQVEALSREERVLAVVGPVLAREAGAAAARAAQLGVPLLALSAAERLTGVGPTIFRCFLTPANQARALARHAVEKLGRRRLAILHPRTAYGETMRAAFAAEAARLGAPVIATFGYPRGESDFRRAARALRRHRLDGLFFPDGHRTVALAVGYLAAQGIPIGLAAGERGTRLLGTNEWFADALLRHAGRYVQGAVLAVGFTPQGARPEAQAFSRGFEAAHGRAPTYVEAYAHDAVTLLRAAVQRGALDRATLARSLLAVEAAGATGALRFDGDRELTAAPVLVQVDGQSFRALE